VTGQNTIGTFNVLEAMRATGAGGSPSPPRLDLRRAFGVPHEAVLPVQTSLYGASKLAGEGLIAAYVTGFGFQASIFRFVSILGERYSHGHVFDFYRKLLADPTEIEVLGNGKQRKSYLYVGDCVEAMLTVLAQAPPGVSVLNLGTDEYCTVEESLGWICLHLGLDPRRRFTGGERGWIGDSPFIFLDTRKVRALGWRPRLSIRQGVVRTLEYLKANHWLLERH
jgi:UDP-glucose 4-epimerase